jgi:hypothetical protein
MLSYYIQIQCSRDRWNKRRKAELQTPFLPKVKSETPVITAGKWVCLQSKAKRFSTHSRGQTAAFTFAP